MDIHDQDYGNVGKSSLPEPIAPIDASRRRFARAGFGASGVILTLVSQPGMAASRICKSPSGGLSGGLQSQPSNQTVLCGGLSPGYWKQHPQMWPTGVYPETTGSVTASPFSGPFPGGSAFQQTASLMAVLMDNKPADDLHNLGMHMVAAYLNVRSGKISFLSIQTLQTMWYEIDKFGKYKPSANHEWDRHKVKCYLEATEEDTPRDDACDLTFT